MNKIPALDRLGEALELAIARDQARARAGWHGWRGGYNRKWRWIGLATAVALGLAIVLGIGPRVATGPDGRRTTPAGPLRVDPASAEVTVTAAGRYYKVLVGNVLADPEAVRQALRQHGLDVTIRFLPASPSVVGTVVASYFEDDTDRDKVRWDYREGRSVDGDVVAVQLPLNYRGRMGLDLGRRTRPGEHYSSVASSAQVAGEALSCANVEGRRVRDVLSILDRRHVTATWRGPDNRVVPASSILDQYVAQTIPVADEQVLILTSPGPPDPDKLALLHGPNGDRRC